MQHLASFWTPEACSQTVLPDRSLLIGLKMVKNAKNRKILMRDFWFLYHFCPLKVTCLVTLFYRKFQLFKNSSKSPIFLPFYQTFVHSKCKSSSLRSQCDFQTPWWGRMHFLYLHSNKIGERKMFNMCIACVFIMFSCSCCLIWSSEQQQFEFCWILWGC